MIGHLAVEAETTKPAICQIEMDFLAQASLGTDAKAIPDDQHPDHQLGIDRWSTHSAVKGSQLAPQLAKLDEPVDGPQEVVSRNVLFKRKLVEQRNLLDLPVSHHDSRSCLIAETESANLMRRNCRLFQHGVIPGSSQTKAQGISSPGRYEANLMWPPNDGERRWNIMLDWTYR